MVRLGLILATLALLMAGPVTAQQQEQPPGPGTSEPAPTVPATPESLSPEEGAGPGGGLVRSPILTINPDRLFSESLYGQRVSDEVQQASENLAAENRRIEAELTAKERSLTERRPEMDPEAFRAEAEAFDTRVQRIRNEQDAKENDLQDIVQRGQAAFRDAVRPILGQLMLERGAAVLVDRRSVVLGVGAIDITDEAITRVDAELGDGADLDASAGTEGASPDDTEEPAETTETPLEPAEATEPPLSGTSEGDDATAPGTLLRQEVPDSGE